MTRTEIDVRRLMLSEERDCYLEIISQCEAIISFATSRLGRKIAAANIKDEAEKLMCGVEIALSDLEDGI